MKTQLLSFLFTFYAKEYQECHIWLLTSWELKISIFTRESEEQYYFNVSLAALGTSVIPLSLALPAVAVWGWLMQLLRRLLAQVSVRDLPAGSAKIWAQSEKASSKSPEAPGWFSNLATWSPAHTTPLNLTIHITGAIEPAAQRLKNWAVNSWMGPSAGKRRRFSQKQNRNFIFCSTFHSPLVTKSMDTGCISTELRGCWPQKCKKGNCSIILIILPPIFMSLWLS